jgi:hypothetical protein
MLKKHYNVGKKFKVFKKLYPKIKIQLLIKSQLQSLKIL